MDNDIYWYKYGTCNDSCQAQILQANSKFRLQYTLQLAFNWLTVQSWLPRDFDTRQKCNKANERKNQEYSFHGCSSMVANTMKKELTRCRL